MMHKSLMMKGDQSKSNIIIYYMYNRLNQTEYNTKKLTMKEIFYFIHEKF